MAKANERVADDPHDLNRFVQAQEGIYQQALSEIRSGRKRSHWMWYIFPQYDGLGDRCTTSNARSEEHTSELQSRSDLVCRLLLEKKKKQLCRRRRHITWHRTHAVHRS